MIYFRKIPLHIEGLDIQEMKGDLVDDFGTLKNFVCVNYEQIQEQLKDKIIFHVTPLCVYLTEITGGVDVHTDGTATNLSYYIKTDGSKTRFWIPNLAKRKKADYLDTVHYDIDTWQIEDLTLADSFYAVDGDCYLMKVDEPHSVDNPTEKHPRYLLKWLWNEDFETVKSNIELL